MPDITMQTRRGVAVAYAMRHYKKPNKTKCRYKIISNPTTTLPMPRLRGYLIQMVIAILSETIDTTGHRLQTNDYYIMCICASQLLKSILFDI